MNVLEVRNIGKKYKRYPKPYSRLIEWVVGSKMHKEKWVLRGITFQVKSGESVGILGHNGAGKSTLLKILTGTTHPSEGNMQITGSISALLELGLGFHPEFTGLQNIYMLGQLMGLKNKDISELLPDIIDFSEIGDYLHQPLRTYSSGMAVRLAFSTVTSVRPDILIVDEALSVGDAYFQHKCFARIRKFREQGTSLLFVSHDPSAVKNLCDRAILLDSGLMIKEGHPDEVLDYYNAVIAKREADYEIKQSIGLNNKLNIRSGNKKIQIDEVNLFFKGERINAIQVGDLIDIQVILSCNNKIKEPTVGFVIKDRLGNEVYGTNTYYLDMNLGYWDSNNRYVVTFSQKLNLGVGTYSITVAVHDSYHHLDQNYDWLEQAAIFQIIPGLEKQFIGTAFLDSTVVFENGGKNSVKYDSGNDYEQN
ncbi:MULTISPECIES: ABC transporter ATP-binding protein [unclassified Paenibacillus]|uniref:ABC transporter ATP-binding protein n=1 Tax=unclassified Paenibacillus TaxID=185978 RepID=UPI00362B1867